MLFFRLEETEQVLHRDADARDSDPAAEAQKQRLGAGADQLDDVGVESDGGHSKDDKELAQSFKRCEDVGIDPGSGDDGSRHGSQNKIENEHRKDLF